MAVWTDTDGEITGHISCIFFFLLITHQKLSEPQDKRVRAEDNDIEKIYGAMHKNR